MVDKQALLMEVADVEGMTEEEEGDNLVLVVQAVDIVVAVGMALLALRLILVTVVGMVVVEQEIVLQRWYLFWEMLACSAGLCSGKVQGSLVVQNVLEEFLEQSGAAIHPFFQPLPSSTSS